MNSISDTDDNESGESIKVTVKLDSVNQFILDNNFCQIDFNCKNLDFNQLPENIQLTYVIKPDLLEKTIGMI